MSADLEADKSCILVRISMCNTEEELKAQIKDIYEAAFGLKKKEAE